MRNAKTWRTLICILGAGLAVRLALLAQFGPVHFNDTDSYFTSFDMFRFHGYLPDHFDWKEDYSSAFRMAGYPSLLRAFDLVFGFSRIGWTLVGVVIVQIIVSLAAAAMLFRTTFLASRQVWAAAAGTVIYLFSLPLIYDLAIMTDSLFNSLLIITVCLSLNLLIAGTRPSVAYAAITGVLVSLMLLLRETALIFMPALTALWLVIVFMRRCSLARIGATTATLCAPFVLVFVAYSAWNEVRTGTRLLTVSGEYALLMPALRIATIHRDTVEHWPPPLPSVVQPGSIPPTLIGAKSVVATLADEQYSPPEIQALAGGALRRAIIEYPLTFLGETLRQFTAWPPLVLIGLPYVVDAFTGTQNGRITKRVVTKYGRPMTHVLINMEADPFPDRYFIFRWVKGDGWLRIGADVMAMVLSALIFIAFVAGAVVATMRLVARQSADPARNLAAAFVFALYFYWTLAHCVFGLEVRYLLGAQALATTCGLLVLVRWFDTFRQYAWDRGWSAAGLALRRAAGKLLTYQSPRKAISSR